MDKSSIVIASILYIGTVDFVYDGLVRAELRIDREVRYIDLPEMIFPCDVTEGDPFYIEHVGGIVEIRCGEPDLE